MIEYFLLTVITFGGFFFLFYFLLAKKVEGVTKRVDAIFTVDKPTPNEASEKEESPLEVQEQNITGIPPDVKFEVEDQTQTPIGYEERKAP